MVDIIKNPTNCPSCGKTASGLPAILSIFGLRNMEDNTTRVQSWCKECRNQGRRVIKIGN